jgi:hypothetical protein
MGPAHFPPQVVAIQSLLLALRDTPALKLVTSRAFCRGTSGREAGNANYNGKPQPIQRQHTNISTFCRKKTKTLTLVYRNPGDSI